MVHDIDALISQTRNELNGLGEVKATLSSAGWEIIRSHFLKVLSAIGEGILEEQDFEKLRRLQERYKAFRAMLETADFFYNDYVNKNAQLLSMLDDKHQIDRYGDSL